MRMWCCTLQCWHKRHITNSKKAPTFSDLECDDCKRAAAALKRKVEDITDEFRAIVDLKNVAACWMLETFGSAVLIMAAASNVRARSYQGCLRRKSDTRRLFRAEL
jgi:hypothetical protein